jgi:hypothetical protein
VPSKPCCKFEFKIDKVRSREAELVWTAPERPNGHNLFYSISLKLESQPLSSMSRLNEENNLNFILYHDTFKRPSWYVDSQLYHTLKGLQPYTKYLANIQACNHDINDEKIFHCLNGTGVQLNTTSAWLRLFTAQDKPENQPPPTIISVSSEGAQISVLRPLKPNGIILLYEVWIRQRQSSDEDWPISDQISLACAIEDWFDPISDMPLIASLGMQSLSKTCHIDKLNMNSEYAISVSSSTIAGRSELSEETRFNTPERRPRCPPIITKAVSSNSSSAFLSWLPSIESSQNEPKWKQCLGGSLKNFSVFETESQKLLYTGLSNSVHLTSLNSSSAYDFSVELCNSVGCASARVNVMTMYEAPSNWRQSAHLMPKVSVVNATALKFDWSAYHEAETRLDKRINLTYKLERSQISFAYPPTPLERGVRMHGFNYFELNTNSSHFPDGYPYFGLMLSFRTLHNSSLVYLAASSSAENELTLIELVNGHVWLVANTHSSLNSCSISVQAAADKPNSFYNDGRWHTLEAFRLDGVASIRVDREQVSFYNSSSCPHQIISDVKSVYVGGAPTVWLINQQQDRVGFVGCLKNLTAMIIHNSIGGQIGSSQMRELNLSDARTRPGEHFDLSMSGCPLELETECVHMLGFGYIYFNLVKSMPVQYQSSTQFEFGLDLRTEWPQGVLYLNYDLLSNQYVFVRLVDQNSIHIMFKGKLMYEEDENAAQQQQQQMHVHFNRTFSIASALASSFEWTSFSFRFDFLRSIFTLNVNNEILASINLLSNEHLVKSNKLQINFYLQPQFYIGGLPKHSLQKTLKALKSTSQSIRRYFAPLFSLLNELDDKAYLSACIRNLNINGFSIELHNVDSINDYVNVRFDGCPNLIASSKSSQQNFEFRKTNVIFEGSTVEAYDVQMSPFTEYFYRVVALNSQGKSASEWLLVRTPAAAPSIIIDIDLLSVTAISGYEIDVYNINEFCCYCNPASQLDNDEPFKGIVEHFVLNVEEQHSTNNSFLPINSYKFFCDSYCLSIAKSETNDQPQNNQDKLIIKARPLTRYSLTMSVCTSGGCTTSPNVEIVTLEEAPTEIEAPVLDEKGIDYLDLSWSKPKYPNGNITGYILRMGKTGDGNEEVAYFGVNNAFKIGNLRPFNSYYFSLEACNRVGCSRSVTVRYNIFTFKKY